LQSLADRVNHAKAGGLGTTERTANLDRLASNEPGVMAADELLVLIEHPHHVLGVGHDIGRRHVLHRTHVADHLPNPTAAQRFLLARRQIMGVADHASLAAT